MKKKNILISFIFVAFSINASEYIVKLGIKSPSGIIVKDFNLDSGSELDKKVCEIEFNEISKISGAWAGLSEVLINKEDGIMDFGAFISKDQYTVTYENVVLRTNGFYKYGESNQFENKSAIRNGNTKSKWMNWSTTGVGSFFRISLNEGILLSSLEYTDWNGYILSDYKIDIYNCNGDLLKSKSFVETQAVTQYEILTLNYADF